MTAKTLEQEAREAAEGFADSVDAETGGTICKGSYMNGFIAAATPRDKEIRELQSLRGNLLTERANYETCIEERDKEIEELRAELAEVRAIKDRYVDRLELAFGKNDRLSAEIASLRAKLEAVPVEEIRAVCEWELGLDFPDTAAISSWLATVTKPIPLPEGEGDAR